MFASNYLRDFLAVLLSGFTLFFLGPIYLSAHSDGGAENFSLLSVFQVGLVYFVFFALPFLLVIFLGRFLNFNRAIDFLTSFVLIWVVISILIFPISSHSGMVSPAEVPLNLLNLALVFLTSLFFALLATNRLVWTAYIFSLVIVAGVIFELTPFVAAQHLKADSGESRAKLIEDFSKLSSGKNIIVLSFDGTPSNIVEDIFRDQNDMEEEFKDFVLFTEAFSTAPATSASIRSELFGHRSYRKSGEIGDPVDLINDISSHPLNLVENSFTYGPYNSFMANAKHKLHHGVFFDELVNFNKFAASYYRIDLSVSRGASSFGYKALRKLKLFSLIDKIVLAIFLEPAEFDSKLRNYSNVSWKKPFVPQVWDFYGIVDSLSVADSEAYSEIAIRMMHFAHTHFPVDFDGECNIRSPSKEWVETNQNYQGLYNQGICELDQFAYFLDRLKTLGVYDNTLIVLKSDHGEPANYFSQPPHALKINGHPNWGVNRYMPLLMVKDFNARRDELEYNKALVGLPDLARTICPATGAGECDIFNGVNLLEFTQRDLAANPDIFIDIVQDEKSSFKFESHKTIRLDRTSGSSILELLQNSEEVVLDLVAASSSYNAE